MEWIVPILGAYNLAGLSKFNAYKRLFANSSAILLTATNTKLIMTLQKVWTITLRSWNELPTASETLKNSENVYFYASANRQILISENIILWNFIIRTPTFYIEPLFAANK